MFELCKKDYRIIDGGEFIADKKWIIPEKNTEFYEFIFVKKGKVYITVNGEKTELSEGDLFIIKPSTTYSGYKFSDIGTTFIRVIVEFFQNITLPVTVKKFSSGELITELLHQICLPSINEAVCDGLFKHLFAAINAEGEFYDIANIRLCEEIGKWIRNNADATLTVKEVAEHFDYNSEYLSRIFKKRFNVGIKAFIDSCIIKRAKDYLLMSDYSIREISELLKFSTASLFTNFYKYHEKCVPHQLRD